MDIDVDGEKQTIVPMFMSLEIFENIYLGGITGSVTIMDTDGNGFIEENQIEFVEDFSFEFESVSGEKLKFEGHLNGIRNEVVKQQKRMYTLDFNSKSVRQNEMKFVTKRFKGEKPEDIAKNMVERIGSTLEPKGEGLPIEFIGSRRKPLDIMKYILDHATTRESQATNKTDENQQESSGTTGFLFWETLDGHRFCPVDDLLKGEQYTSHDEFRLQTAQKGLSMEESVKCIIDYEFPQIGDFQSKLRSGAYKSKHVSFDIDTGEYREYVYEAKEGKSGSTTKKQVELVGGITRIVSKIFNNERSENTCEKADQDKYDQTRLSTQQSISRQNSFADQHGRVVLSPQFEMRAGDTLDISIAKVSSTESSGEANKKHSGRYIIKQVSHHIFFDQKAYTKLSTIRSVTQQNEQTST